ncbi:hypothetical protein [Vallitalea sp.]|jgi:hypothetical protein|uniref:hypothetical protein n=1 Tax=Vallitalea sp. TaxID=1882829 RepID=UPI0025EA513B|nr:hypothetical protein [Vallitalea sp.]MCT4686181.1 hypothetical protein [Vallitalea sp.]
MIRNNNRKSILLVFISLLSLLLFSGCTNKQVVDLNTDKIINRKANNKNTNEDIPKIEDVTNNHSSKPNLIKSDYENSANTQNNTSSKSITMDILNVELIKENIYPEHRYYSPDGKNYIKETLAPDTYIKSFYLNDLSESIDYVMVEDVFDHKYNSVCWLSNDQVILTGSNIYDIKNNKKINLGIENYWFPPEDINEKKYEYGGLKYSINNSKTLIAYSFFEQDLNKIYIYNIKTQEYLKLDENRSFERPSGRIYWDKNDNLYLDTFGDTSTGFQITKYSIKDKSKSIFKENYSIDSLLPNSDYCILFNINSHEYEIFNLEKNTTIFIFNNNIIWHMTHNSLIYYDKKTQLVNKYIFSEDKQLPIACLKKIIKSNGDLPYLDYAQESCNIFIYNYTNESKKATHYIVKSRNSPK